MQPYSSRSSLKFWKFLLLMFSSVIAVVTSGNIDVLTATTPREIITLAESKIRWEQSYEYQIKKVVFEDLNKVAGRGVTPEVRKIFIADNYAVASWLLGESGGQAVLVKEQNNWRLLTSGGGAINAAYLHHLGVPEEQTQKLLTLMHRETK